MFPRCVFAVLDEHWAVGLTSFRSSYTDVAAVDRVGLWTRPRRRQQQRMPLGQLARRPRLEHKLTDWNTHTTHSSNIHDDSKIHDFRRFLTYTRSRAHEHATPHTPTVHTYPAHPIRIPSHGCLHLTAPHSHRIADKTRDSWHRQVIHSLLYLCYDAVCIPCFCACPYRLHGSLACLLRPYTLWFFLTIPFPSVSRYFLFEVAAPPFAVGFLWISCFPCTVLGSHIRLLRTPSANIDNTRD